MKKEGKIFRYKKPEYLLKSKIVVASDFNNEPFTWEINKSPNTRKSWNKTTFNFHNFLTLFSPSQRTNTYNYINNPANNTFRRIYNGGRRREEVYN